MRNGAISMRVLVAGRQIDEYTHSGDTFVEGRDGSEYVLEFQNHLFARVAIVASVDGLSIMSGKLASVNDGAYILAPNETLAVTGWRLNDETVAKFVFGQAPEGYAALTGHAEKTGVIGVVAYAEKYTPPPPVYRNNDFGVTRSGGGAKGMMGQAASAGAPTNPSGKLDMGTKFGDAAGFKTRQISFERGDNLGLMQLYYASATVLRQRGVELTRPKGLPELPQAFVDGCTPPPGWRDNRSVT